MNRLATVVPVALLLTLLLLFKAFDSFGRAVLTLLNVPFALVGGVFGLWLAGMPVSVAAAVGFIALIGQASLNGVLVMSAIVDRRERGEPLDEAIVKGCRDRLRPVLMTASLAALGWCGGALAQHRQRDAAAAGGGDRVRHDVGVQPDAAAAAGMYRLYGRWPSGWCRCGRESRRSASEAGRGGRRRRRAARQAEPPAARRGLQGHRARRRSRAARLPGHRGDDEGARSDRADVEMPGARALRPR